MVLLGPFEDCLGSCHVMIGFAYVSVKGSVTEDPRGALLGLG